MTLAEYLGNPVYSAYIPRVIQYINNTRFFSFVFANLFLWRGWYENRLKLQLKISTFSESMKISKLIHKLIVIMVLFLTIATYITYAHTFLQLYINKNLIVKTPFYLVKNGHLQSTIEITAVIYGLYLET